MYRKWLLITLATILILMTGAPTALASPPRGDITHVVQAGETLYSIARRYGVDVNTIARYNGIVNPNHLYAGQRLAIPTSNTPAQPPASGDVHVVQPGENLLRIALRYSVDVWAMARANNITNLNHIYVGQRLVIPKATPAPAPKPQPQPVWTPSSWPGPWSAEYFDNPTLSGEPYVTREDEIINFDWGWGPPAGGMPSNAFSVRWSGTFHFDAGVYRFYTKIDDGVRVYLDGERIINSWRDGGFRLYSADRALEAGEHTIQVEYYDRMQVARAHFLWVMLSSADPTATPHPDATATPIAPQPSETEWYGEFFNNEELAGDPVATQRVPYIGFEWGTGSPMPEVWQDHFSARWTRKMRLNTDHYRFCAMSDDGVRIWVGDTLVLDEWRASAGEAHCGVYWADTGVYDVKIEYYEHGGDALIYVWWEPH
jgi:LysM repeat protein